ncbi:MAG: polymerase, sigma-24 subunit, subfamily [Verrucomicrobia bacterium]|nr:polymerase, sigma-24 subunit, subfamily [Verrucomicrobiota bacterium]
MHDDDDVSLLRRYARDRSQAAFAALVQRRIGLVYSCALRRVGNDTQLAEDVTQEVFSALARKAPELCQRSCLLGWLHVSAQRAAAEIVRTEQRRKSRETQATLMENILHPPTATPETDWTHLRPLLDELITDLKDVDREALMLRFFEKRPFAEIAATLSLTEEGARKRTERAVERIRAELARRGVTSSSGALAFVLAEQTASAVPAALAGNITAAAFAEVAAAGVGTSVLAGVASALVSDTALVLATFMAGAGLVTWQLRSNAQLESVLARVKNSQGEVRALHHDNQRLIRRIAEADDLRRDQAAAASEPPRTTANARTENGPAVNVLVTAKGTIAWENQPITLNDYLQRLADLHSIPADRRPQLFVQGAPGARFDATAYTIEQASRAGIADIAIAVPGTPGPRADWITTPVAAPGPAEKNPPTVPDPAIDAPK